MKVTVEIEELDGIVAQAIIDTWKGSKQEIARLTSLDRKLKDFEEEDLRVNIDVKVACETLIRWYLPLDEATEIIYGHYSVLNDELGYPRS